MVAIVLFEVPHQAGKGASVPLAIGLAIWREAPDRHSQGVDHAPKAFLIVLNPCGGIVHVAVLPGGKPQEH